MAEEELKIEGEDLFQEVFGEDPEEKEAIEKLRQKKEEEKDRKKKPEKDQETAPGKPGEGEGTEEGKRGDLEGKEDSFETEGVPEEKGIPAPMRAQARKPGKKRARAQKAGMLKTEKALQDPVISIEELERDIKEIKKDEKGTGREEGGGGRAERLMEELLPAPGKLPEPAKEKAEKAPLKKPAKKKEAREPGEEEADQELEDFVAEGQSPLTGETLPLLKLLEDKSGQAYIGRKKSLLEKYADTGALFLGKIQEEGLEEKPVLLDSLHPHVVFVCGARGSGKSYVLGVIAEELALKNPNVGCIVIDPVGVFWSMKYPNREEKELESLAAWGMVPEGLKNMRVFIPKGNEKETPKGTFDKTFSMRPSLLTSQDWALTFGLERFSPTGLLLDKVLAKIQKGYRTKDGERIEGKENYAMDDVILCLNYDAELSSREKGYKMDSIRALSSRFEAAKSWGIFDEKGTPLSELSREGQLTIIDTSFLDDNVSALVIGILARRLLAARKITTRKEAAKRMKTIEVDELLELDVPPTWLFIDEAHTLIPSGNAKTPASEGLVEYVKQGRRPGLSLVFATQQPSAIDTKVLSQLDIILSHKLVFNDDIKAVFKRTPTIIPYKFKVSTFIKTLPVGIALCGDRREETSRAFVMKVRTRKSQHEGREAETTGVVSELSDDQVEKLAIEMCWRKLDRDKVLEEEEGEQALATLNAKHKTRVPWDKIKEELAKRGAGWQEDKSQFFIGKPPSEEGEGAISLLEMKKRAEELLEEEKFEQEHPQEEEEEGQEEERPKRKVHRQGIARDRMERQEEREEELLSFAVNVPEEMARKIVEEKRQRKAFGLLGEEETLAEFALQHAPVYRAEVAFPHPNGAFRKGVIFLNSLSGEFLFYDNKTFQESSGLKEFFSLERDAIRVLNAVGKRERSIQEIAQKTGLEEAAIGELARGLEQQGQLRKRSERGRTLYSLRKPIDLKNANPLQPLFSSVDQVPLARPEDVSPLKGRIDEEAAQELLNKMWPQAQVRKLQAVYWPIYEALLQTPSGKLRKMRVDAVTGKRMSLS